VREARVVRRRKRMKRVGMNLLPSDARRMTTKRRRRTTTKAKRRRKRYL
jgi:hypothetical protein